MQRQDIPPFEWISGLYNEEESRAHKETKPGTWAFWGFESIVWATKKVVTEKL